MMEACMVQSVFLFLKVAFHKHVILFLGLEVKGMSNAHEEVNWFLKGE